MKRFMNRFISDVKEDPMLILCIAIGAMIACAFGLKWWLGVLAMITVMALWD